MSPWFPDGDVRVAEVQTAVGETADQAVPPPAVCLLRSQHPHLLLQSSTTTLTLSHVDQYLVIPIQDFQFRSALLKNCSVGGSRGTIYLSIGLLTH